MVQDEIEKWIGENYLYSPTDGTLTRANSRGRWSAGAEVGTCVGKRGYKTILIKGKRLYVHRVLFYMHHGEWPEFVDHIDGDKTNNSLSNLRSVDRSTNAKNIYKPHVDTESGHLGVLKRKDTGKWSVRFQGKSIGCYNELREAVKAYELASNESLTP